VWIVLEHHGVWGAKAVRDCDLSEAVKRRLSMWESEIEGARVQLVRRSGRARSGVRLWFGVSDLGGARVVEWTLAEADALLEVDLAREVDTLRRGETPLGARESSEPLVLVCTNGRRDVCCALRGNPVAQALAKEPGLSTWQTTHLGGHRFAATLLQLPQGLCYGWVEPEEVPELAEAIRRAEVFRVDRLRGRTALAKPEQAAESLWRQRTGERAIDALVYAEHREHEGHMMVTLRDRSGHEHALEVEYRQLGVSASPSCGKAPEPVGGWVPCL